MEFVADYRTPLAKERITFLSTLNIYKAFYFSESEEGEDDWKAARLYWENTFSASITKLLNVSLYVQVLYDKRVIDEMQFKQTLSLNLTYKLL